MLHGLFLIMHVRGVDAATDAKGQSVGYWVGGLMYLMYLGEVRVTYVPR
jgi:hypothetical protein